MRVGAIMTTVSQLIPILTKGYEAKCKELGIIQRSREIKTPADLMLLCLFHLNNGCSLIEVSEAAKLLKIGEFSDVAFMKKFAKCSEWFKWISENLLTVMLANYQKPIFLENYRPIAFDASIVSEKGASAQTYRLHYGVDIFKMSSVCHKITKQEIGESLLNFELSQGDLAIADRIYGTLNGVLHCIENKADYIFRLRTNHFAIYDKDGGKLNIISETSGLRHGDCTNLSGFIQNGESRIPIRVCIKRKSLQECEASKKKLLRRQSRTGKKLSCTTVKFNEYIVLITSLPNNITTEDILETYRLRWQVEILFKRLKSILGFGELPKKTEASSLAWLNGKLMVALLIEHLLSTSLFFPKADIPPQYLERDKVDISHYHI